MNISFFHYKSGNREEAEGENSFKKDFFRTITFKNHKRHIENCFLQTF